MSRHTQHLLALAAQRERAKRRRADNYAPWLRTIRRAAGLTQLQLARRARVDHSLISLLESGKRDLASVGYATAVRLAAALHVTPDELIPVAIEEEQAS